MQRKHIYLLQIIILAALIGSIIFRYKNPYKLTLAGDDFYSDYMHYEDETWSVYKGDIPQSNIDLLKSKPFELPTGSYTVKVYYDAEEQQSCELKASTNAVFLHANGFQLSRNKHQVDYNFFTTQSIDNAFLNIKYNGSGDFFISKIEVMSNVRCLNVLFFILICIFALWDIMAFSDIIAKQRQILLILLGITFAGALPIFMEGYIFTGDYAFHMARIEGIAQGIKSGQFPVKLDPSFNDGYGYPAATFYGNFLLYLPAFLRIVGFSVVTSYKIYIFMITFLTTITSYYCSKKIFHNDSTALVTSFSYIVSSYRLVDVFGRTAVGEYTALAFVPIVFLAIYGIYNDNVNCKIYRNNVYLLTFGVTGILYTHILTTEMVLFIVICIILVLWRKTIRKQTIIVFFNSLIYILLIGAAFWVPFVDYYLHTDILIKSSVNGVPYIQEHGAYIIDFFGFFRRVVKYSGSNIVDRMQFTPGIVLVGALVCAIVLVIKNRSKDKTLLFTAMACVLLFMASNLFPWNILSKTTILGRLLSQVQFPWRYIGITLCVLMILLGIVIESGIIDKKLIISIVLIMNFLQIGFFVSDFSETYAQSRYLDFAEMPQYTYSVDHPISALGGTEYLLVGTDIEQLDYFVNAENANAWIERENGVSMDVHVEANNDASIEVPRFNYPNYVAYDNNGNNYTIISGTNNKIKILFREAFEGTVYLRYREPVYWRISEMISIISALVILSMKYRSRIEQKKTT